MVITFRSRPNQSFSINVKFQNEIIQKQIFFNSLMCLNF